MSRFIMSGVEVVPGPSKPTHEAEMIFVNVTEIYSPAFVGQASKLHSVLLGHPDVVVYYFRDMENSISHEMLS